jgi:uncharacterized membrane protein HdeD (DUF308 family)
MTTHDPLAQHFEPIVVEGPLTSLQRPWAALLLLGIVQLVCGALALVVPTAASVAAVAIFGALMLVSGVFQAVHAFTVKKWRGATLEAFGSLLYAVAGLLALMFPLTGALTLTIVVAVLLIGDGVARCALAYRLKPWDGWKWFLGAGIASVAVGLLLLLGWPLTGLWGIGILLGVNLLYSGVTHCMLAIAFRARTARALNREPLDGALRR